jgi:CHAT domain
MNIKHVVLVGLLSCTALALPGLAQPTGNLPGDYDMLLNRMEAQPSDSLKGLIYDQILRSQHASIDKEIVLRQKMRYADAATLRLFYTKDSLLRQIARAYEQPAAKRGSVAALTQAARALEDTILSQVRRGNAYFLALSVKFIREAYQADPSIKCLFCYWKTALRKGDQALADQLSRYALLQEQQTLRWQQVRAALRQYDAALEFVVWRNAATGALQYGAFVLRRNDTAPQYVALCTQEALDELLQKGGADEAYFQETLYAPPPDVETLTLHQLVWKPLEPLLAKCQRIYYAPAGDLLRVNMGAIAPAANQPPLQNRFGFVRINSTRSLITAGSNAAAQKALPAIQLPCRIKKPVDSEFAARFFGNIAVDYYDPDLYRQGKDAVLFGNIAYDMDSMAIRNPGLYPEYRPAISPTGQLPRRRQQRGRMADWDFLYGTKAEIDGIHAMLLPSGYKVNLLEGYAASEEALKALGRRSASPRILHIATHGFFLTDAAQQQTDEQLNRSGLILAGANYAWKNERPLSGMEDGILTAFEIGSLNLDNTELVVLSACETGLGYIVNNEGVFGLQRAFKKAGVKNLLVSLWSIPDQATQLLMNRFYQNCLEKDLPMREALQAAQQWMRTQDAYRSPYYWAGFVLLE